MYPSVIENFVYTIKGIKDVCVVGVKHPIFIEMPAIVIIKEKKSQLQEIDVKNIISQKLGMKMFGDEIFVYFVDEFPKTPSGKVQKRLVKNIAMEKYNETHQHVF